MSPSSISIQSALITLSTLILLFNKCNGVIFTGQIPATSNNKYENHIINCDDNQDFIISCFNTIIHCPSTCNCDIKCKSGPSNNVCENIQITCPTNGNCHISSTSDSACKHASINCNKSNSLTVTCTGKNTCENTTIDARYSNNFLLECGIASENRLCQFKYIFPPPNINNTMTNKKSKTIAGDLFLSTNNISITLQNVDSGTPQPSSPKTISYGQNNTNTTASPIPEAPVKIEIQLPKHLTNHKHFIYNIPPINYK